MKTQELIDKFETIKLIVENLPEQEMQSDEDQMQNIYNICENVIMDWRIEKRLKNETRA